MYKPTKRLLTCGLALSLVAVGSFSVLADETNEETTDAGLSAKVEMYISEGTSEDPVSDLTKGAASIQDEPEITRREVIPGITVKPSLIALEERLKGEANSKKLAPSEYPQFKDRAIATVDAELNIREEPDAESKLIGTMRRGDVCMAYESKDGWTKIASGCCEGYVKTEYLAFGDDAGRWAKENELPMEAVVKTETLKVREGADYESDVITMIPHDEAYEVVSVDGDWVLLAVDYDVQGYVNKQYVELRYSVGRALSVEEQELAAAARAEAEEARLHQTPQEEGYQDVYQDNTDYGNSETNNNDTYDNNDNNNTYDNNETNNNETYDNNDTYETPQETYETPQETYDTPQETYEEPEPETPVEEPSYDAPSGAGGDALAAYALQFVGNPYVWGGTSLTNGADCSGFVLSIYAQWGIYLPHDAELQANYGTEVSLSELMPGDLLFYSSGGYAIGHVAIYIGGGQVVHASSPSTGIKVSVYNYRTPCKAVRLLP